MQRRRHAPDDIISDKASQHENGQAEDKEILLAADMVARTIVAPAELPIGIVTACLGGPVFLWMLLTNVRQIET